MAAQQSRTNKTTNAPKNNPNIDSLATALTNLGIDTAKSASLEEALSKLSITPTNSVYDAMKKVNDTSLSSIEAAIAIYEAMSVVIDSRLDLDMEDPQLDVVCDSLAATKCCVILYEMKRTLVTGDRWLCPIERDEWKV